MTNSTEISIEGKVIGLWFGMPAVRKISEASNLYPVMDADGSYNEFGIAHILLGGYLNERMIREIPPTLELSFFVDYCEKTWISRDVDDLGAANWQQLLDIVNFFSESFLVKSMIEKQKKRRAQKAQEMTTMMTTEMMSPTKSSGTETNLSASVNSE